jgi:hypothetical protein
MHDFQHRGIRTMTEHKSTTSTTVRGGIYLTLILLVSCAPKLYRENSTPPSLELRYEPSSPLAQATHFPVSLAIRTEVESPLPATTPDQMSIGLGFAPREELFEILGDRLVREIGSRGLIRDVSDWHRGIEADYFLRVQLLSQQAALLNSQEVESVWQVEGRSRKLERDQREKPSPLRLSSSLVVTLFTNTNLPIATKDLVLAVVHPDATCGDYISLGMLLKEGSEDRDFPWKQQKLRQVRQTDGDHALSQARKCFTESYDLLVTKVITQVADFSLSGIEAVQPSPDGHEDATAAESEKVAFIIASIPSGADVMVDERFVGQTPLRLSVSRDEAHSVQLSAAGFEAMVKLIDPSSFGDESVQHLLYRLKAKVE